MHRLRQDGRGFTLIELLVVIAIIALLIGILLPSLGAARRAAWAVKAGVNSRSIAQAVAAYTIENEDFYPLAYAYPETEDGYEWDPAAQGETSQENPYGNNGYVHWSGVLFEFGKLPEEAFESPGTTSRGAPRTNWGDDPRDSENWQISDTGATGGNPMELEDRQVSRLGFTVNGAIMPRNKLGITSEERLNRLVRDSEIFNPSLTIMSAEFRDAGQWRSIATQDNSFGGQGATGDSSGSDGFSKSHRPIVPFLARSADSVYAEPVRQSGIISFRYPRVSEWDANNPANLSDRALWWIPKSRPTIVMASTQHDGKGNYAFGDGSVRRLTIEETIRDRLWGDRFYSITGNQTVEGPGYPAWDAGWGQRQ